MGARRSRSPPRGRAAGRAARVGARAGRARARPGPAALVVLVTTPTAERAAEIARVLVEEGLAACGNVVPQVRSLYRWEGKVQDEAEALLVLKTTRGRLEALRGRVLALHPYQVPEVIALAVEAGHPAYLEWIAASTR